MLAPPRITVTRTSRRPSTVSSRSCPSHMTLSIRMAFIAVFLLLHLPAPCPPIPATTFPGVAPASSYHRYYTGHRRSTLLAVAGYPGFAKQAIVPSYQASLAYPAYPMLVRRALLAFPAFR